MDASIKLRTEARLYMYSSADASVGDTGSLYVP